MYRFQLVPLLLFELFQIYEIRIQYRGERSCVVVKMLAGSQQIADLFLIRDILNREVSTKIKK